MVEAKRSVMLRSDDRGDTWKVVNDAFTTFHVHGSGVAERIAGRPFYYAQVRVDPTNEDRLYNLHGTIDRSEDGGRVFRPIVGSEWMHGDHHALWVSPNGKILIDGNDAGVYLSRDRGDSWRFIENLPLGQFYHVNVDLATPFNVMGGLQDNNMWHGPSSVWHNGGIRFYDWKNIGSGDGFAALAAPNNSRYVYTAREGGRIIRSDLQTGELQPIRPAHPEAIRAPVQLERRDGDRPARRGALHREPVRPSQHGHGEDLDPHQPRPHHQRPREADGGPIRRAHDRRQRGGESHHHPHHRAVAGRARGCSGSAPTTATCS